MPLLRKGTPPGDDFDTSTITTDPDGTWHAVSPARQVTILPDCQKAELRWTHALPLRPWRTRKRARAIKVAATTRFPWRLFHRNGLKKNLRTGETTHARMLVAEVRGVRVYFHGSHVVITTQDLYL